ncbi:hypothetical protein, partial [Micromonospora sp. DT229]|uniref:hypothetical protein n=1 Tax=Micromonospora sp. DT229 TaxID=3393430 RepID=UPI003CFB5C9E
TAARLDTFARVAPINPYTLLRSPHWLCAVAAVIGAALHAAGESLVKKSNRMLYISVRSELISIKQDEGFNEGVFVFKEPSDGMSRASIAKFVVRQAARDATERIAAKVLPKYTEAYKAIGVAPPPEETSDLVPGPSPASQSQAGRN